MYSAAGALPERSPQTQGLAPWLGRAASLLAGLALVGVLAGCEADPTPTAVPPRGTSAAGRAALLAVPTVSPPPSPVPAATPTPAPKQRRGGILRQVSTSSYPTLDPHLSSRQGMDGYGLLYNHLLTYALADEKSGRFEVRPELAESCERVAPDTYRLRLRPGVKFHDGSDLDAATVRWNLERLLVHPRSASHGPLAIVQSVEAPDGRTVQIKLTSPNAALPALLTRGGGGMAAMVSRAAMEKLGEDGFASQGVGTGPMQLATWQKDSQLVLRRWDKYWEKGEDGQPLPYLEGYIEQHRPDVAAAFKEIKDGTAGLMSNITMEQVASARSDGRLTYWELGWAGTVYFHAGFNAESGPFRNPKLRQAALYAVDREKLAAWLAPGFARAHYYPVWRPGMLGYDEKLPRYTLNMAKAQKLVKEASPGGAPTVFLSTIAGGPEARIGELVQAAWTEAGMSVQLETLEAMAFHSKLAAGSYQAGFWRDGSVAGDPEMAIGRLTRGNAANLFNYASPALDACLQEARGEADGARRGEAYGRCQRTIFDEAAIGTGFRLPENRVFSKALKGLAVQIVYNDLRGAWLEN